MATRKGETVNVGGSPRPFRGQKKKKRGGNMKEKECHTNSTGPRGGVWGGKDFGEKKCFPPRGRLRWKKQEEKNGKTRKISLGGGKNGSFDVLGKGRDGNKKGKKLGGF